MEIEVRYETSKHTPAFPQCKNKQVKKQINKKTWLYIKCLIVEQLEYPSVPFKVKINTNTL